MTTARFLVGLIFLLSASVLTARAPYPTFVKNKEGNSIVSSPEVMMRFEKIVLNSKANPSQIDGDIRDIERRLAPIMVPLVFSPGSIPIPKWMLNQPSGFCGGLDADLFLATLPLPDDKLMDATVYALSFSLLPSQLSWATRDHSETPDTVSLIDMLRLQSVMSAPPGRRYPITRELWNTLHTSSNPVYRFIALEKFDSVEQTPAELLALYRECLFGACTYLEDRALEAIRSHNDFREEVANLLEEYLATNPPTNDGTFSGLRSAFDNPREGAKQVIEMIRNPDKWSSTTTHPPSKPKPTDGIEILSKSQAAKIFGSAPPTKDPVSDMTITPQSEEPTISTQLNWLGILIVIVTALGLLGWLIKRRP